jgi:hypothetical protein
MLSSGQKRKWIFLSAVTVGLILVVLAGYWALKGKREAPPTTGLPRMANLPAKTETAVPPPPSYPPDAPILEQVRKALREGISPAEAVAMSKKLPDRPERADAAFLLLEYAAESGNSEAALAVGYYYDPSYKGPSGSIRKNPMRAYEWYQAAMAGGQQQAQVQMAQLRVWVEKKAEQGASDAQKLLESWR